MITVPRQAQREAWAYLWLELWLLQEHTPSPDGLWPQDEGVAREARARAISSLRQKAERHAGEEAIQQAIDRLGEATQVGGGK